jgi:PrtD family type I secretion system ABC transporter
MRPTMKQMTPEPRQTARARRVQQEPDLLRNAIRQTRPGFVTAIVFSFFINLLAFVGPVYMLQMYDRVLGSRNETTLVVLTLIAAYLLIVYAGLERIRSAILVRLGLLFDSLSRADLFRAVLKGVIRQPAGGHSQALRDLDTVREFLTGAGLISFCDAPWVPIFIAGTFVLHSWFGWISLAGAILIFGLAIANELLTREQLKAASVNAVVAGSYALATLRNAEVLHAMAMAKGLENRWLSKQDQVLKLQAAASDRAGFLLAATKFFRAFLQIAILGTGAYLAIIQETSAGAMIAASIIMGRALAPVELVVGHWKHFLGARSAYERITALLKIAPADGQKMKLPTPRGAVSVESAAVIPPGGKELVLRGISFALNAGEMLAIIGPSAAGKSSLARALVGVWPVVSGHVRIDGADHAHWDNEQLGAHIGYLPQDVELFAGTIAENLSRFGDQDENAIVSAGKMAGVHDMIQNLPQGYNTQIGEGGQALSGGQRQRIGLARALYGSPALIVLDEPNASLDHEGEAALVSAIQQLRKDGRTVVVVSHKTNLLSLVDKIVLLSQGQMQSFGNRDEILSKLYPRPVKVAPISSSR